MLSRCFSPLRNFMTGTVVNRYSGVKRFTETKRFCNMEHRIERYENGARKREQYFKFGLSHHDKKPASTYWYPNGQKAFEVYFKNGLEHRINKPAITHWSQEGKTLYEMWYTNGIWHKKNGSRITESARSKANEVFRDAMKIIRID